MLASISCLRSIRVCKGTLVMYTSLTTPPMMHAVQAEAYNVNLRSQTWMCLNRVGSGAGHPTGIAQYLTRLDGWQDENAYRRRRLHQPLVTAEPSLSLR